MKLIRGAPSGYCFALAVVYLLTPGCNTATGDVLVRLAQPGEGGSGVLDGADAADIGCVPTATTLTLAVHPTVRLGGASQRGGKYDVVFQDANDTYLVTFDESGPLFERLLAQDLTMDSPRIAAGESGQLRVAFQDFRIAGKWRVYSQTIDRPGIAADALADDGIQVSDDQAGESVGPLIRPSTSDYGVLFRADESVAFVTIGAAGDARSRVLLPAAMPLPDIVGLDSTSRGYLAVVHRAQYELEWYALDGAHQANGPRITANALDATSNGDGLTVVGQRDGALFLADLAFGADQTGLDRAWPQAPVVEALMTPASFEAAKFGANILVSWLEATGRLKASASTQGSVIDVATTAIQGPRLVASEREVWVLWVEEMPPNQALRGARLCP